MRHGTLEARDALANERPRIYRSLALAFEDDPVSSFIFPRAAGRVERLERFYALSVPTLTRDGRLLTNIGLNGGAVWQAPNPVRPRPLLQFWTLARLIATLGRQTAAGARLAQTLERVHLREPHWYLGILGTAPAHQGQGLGSALMQPILDECDEQGIISYLESSKVENIPFYERHGFSVIEEVQIPDGPKMWPMRREAQRR